MFKRIIALLLVLLLSVSCALASGFTTDVDAINEAAKSVLMLEVYDENDYEIATGSGFVVGNNRILVTNCHVIEDADYIIGLSDDGYTYILNKVFLADENADLALLGFFSPTDLVPLSLNDDEVRRAEPIVAIGSPMGLANTVSMGNVSAVFSSDGVDYIQFTAPISHGSSGGALFDDDGNVIGVSTSTYSEDNAQNIILP